MEKSVTFPVGDVMLEGLLWTPPSSPAMGVVLCHPHPLYGGEMHNTIVAALAETLQHAGIMTLRFNFRGVGQSQGTHGHGEAEVADVQAAVTALLGHHAVPTVVVAGYSFGAMVGLRAGAQDARVHSLIGVALPLARRDASFLLTAYKPTLLISGDQDDISPVPALQDLVAKLPGPKKLVTIPHADHFFWGQERIVAQAALTFLQSA